MNPTVTFYCKRYTAYWLTHLFGSPVRFPHKSMAKRIFLTSLEKKYHPSREYDLRQYPEAVEVAMNINDHTIHGQSISLQFQHHINRTFEDDIKLHMHSFVFAHVKKGMSIPKAIRLFRAEFGFTESVWSDEAIRSAYFRREADLENIYCGSATIKYKYATTE